MSSSNANTTPTAATSNTVEKEETAANKGLLGIDFNNPTHFLLTAAGIGLLSWVGGNVIKNILYRPLPPLPIQQQRRVPKYTTEEQRQIDYQRELDLRNQRERASAMTDEEMYYQSIRGINNTNDSLRPYAIHRKNYEPQNYVSEDEQEIDIIDDNQVLYNNYVAAATPAPAPIPTTTITHRQYQQPNRQQQQVQKKIVYHQPDDSLVMTDNDIEVDMNSLPPEFTNVGNTEFQNIKPVERRQQQEQQSDDIYNLENMEISEEELKKMEANTFTNNNGNNEYY